MINRSELYDGRFGRDDRQEILFIDVGECLSQLTPGWPFGTARRVPIELKSSVDAPFQCEAAVTFRKS